MSDSAGRAFQSLAVRRNEVFRKCDVLYTVTPVWAGVNKISCIFSCDLLIFVLLPLNCPEI